MTTARPSNIADPVMHMHKQEHQIAMRTGRPVRSKLSSTPEWYPLCMTDAKLKLFSKVLLCSSRTSFPLASQCHSFAQKASMAYRRPRYGP
jgi:hypothetical protein